MIQKVIKREKVKKNLSFLLFCLLPVTLAADFTKKEEVVIDDKRCLMWQDDMDSGKIQLLWEEAIDYCEALDLEGYDDWRLPNINELKTISKKDRGVSMQFALVDAFEHVGYNPYWSSTTLHGSESFAWEVSFHWGVVSPEVKVFFPRFVRCVRDNPEK